MKNVKSKHFALFWFSHLFYLPFYVLLFAHGRLEDALHNVLLTRSYLASFTWTTFLFALRCLTSHVTRI